MSVQDFSRNVSTKSSALFYGNAVIVAAVPHWLFWRVVQMEVGSRCSSRCRPGEERRALQPKDAWMPWVVVTAVATYLLAFAYRNTQFVLKHK